MNIHAVIFLFLLGAILVWEIMRHLFVKKLYIEDHHLWLELGSPKGIIGRLFVLDGLQLEKFILFKRYESLKSQSLLAECIKLHRILNVVFLIMSIAILSFFM